MAFRATRHLLNVLPPASTASVAVSAWRLVGAAGVAGGAAAVAWRSDVGDMPGEEERFRGGLPRACRDPRSGRFVNPWLTEEGKDPCERPPSDIFRLLREWNGGRSLSEPAASLADVAPAVREPRAVDWAAVRAARDDLNGPVLATWLGHAAVLCAYRGQLVLCDPVFSERCSPFSFAGPRRLVSCPVDPSLADWPDDLAPDLILVSHAHYDHLDEATVSALHARFPKAKFVAPLGLGTWFRDHGITLASEMDWWQEDCTLMGSSLSLVCLPAQHWANRWPWDRNVTLWCGYGVVDREAGDQNMPFYFAGDTGYCPVFKQIGAKFDVGLAAVPIGAYEPRWFMSAQHCDPAEAVQIVSDLDAEVALSIHWGTYPLTAETSAQVLEELSAARGADGRLQAVQAGGALYGFPCRAHIGKIL
mmetsp:Transcript_60031/g.172314  ORF Transcript_60031/g.172314 Transcript_60031/m.172314 type:complete len:419 (-) Transcript_60031:125-1381(-)